MSGKLHKRLRKIANRAKQEGEPDVGYVRRRDGRVEVVGGSTRSVVKALKSLNRRR